MTNERQGGIVVDEASGRATAHVVGAVVEDRPQSGANQSKSEFSELTRRVGTQLLSP